MNAISQSKRLNDLQLNKKYVVLGTYLYTETT